MALMPLLRSMLRRAPANDQRRHARTSRVALKLVMEGRTYKTLDWSVGGFAIADYHDTLKVKDTISGTVLPRRSISEGAFRAEVMRIQPGDRVGLRWLDIAGPTFVSLSSYRR